MSKALEKSSSTRSIWWVFSRVLVRSLIVEAMLSVGEDVVAFKMFMD